MGDVSQFDLVAIGGGFAGLRVAEDAVQGKERGK